MKKHSIFTQFLPLFNKQFIKRLLSRWIVNFIILSLAEWLFFLQLDVLVIRQQGKWGIANEYPGVIAFLGLPAIFVASLVVALLHTETDRKNNYPRLYWVVYFIPAAILLCADYFSYQYSVNYTTKRDQKLRQELELELKENKQTNYVMLADMYKYGWGGTQDISKADELYQKGCENTNVKSLAIENCKKAKNYYRLRILLKDSNDPYDMVTLAIIYEAGLGGLKNHAKAQDLYQKVCPNKNDFICKDYKPFQ